MRRAKKPVKCSYCPSVMLRFRRRPVNTCRSCRAKTQHRYYEANITTARATSRDWYVANKARKDAMRRKWVEAHPGKQRKYSKRYRKSLRTTDATIARIVTCSCGGPHFPERRFSILRRSADLTRGEIHEAWPCLWPRTAAGERKLERDLAGVRARRTA